MPHELLNLLELRPAFKAGCNCRNPANYKKLAQIVEKMTILCMEIVKNSEN